jgi:hypothetical protein
MYATSNLRSILSANSKIKSAIVFKESIDSKMYQLRISRTFRHVGTKAISLLTERHLSNRLTTHIPVPIKTTWGDFRVSSVCPRYLIFHIPRHIQPIHAT